MTHKLIFHKTAQWLDKGVMGYRRPGQSKFTLYDWKQPTERLEWQSGLSALELVEGNRASTERQNEMLHELQGVWRSEHIISVEFLGRRPVDRDQARDMRYIMNIQNSMMEQYWSSLNDSHIYAETKLKVQQNMKKIHRRSFITLSSPKEPFGCSTEDVVSFPNWVFP